MSHWTLQDHPLHQAIYELCQQIEKCGCSVELTKAVTMAGDLQAKVYELRMELEKQKVIVGIQDKLIKNLEQIDENNKVIISRYKEGKG